MTRGRLALTALGLLLSAIAVAAMLRAFHAADVAEHLREVQIGWFLAGMGVTVVGYVIRAYRWQALLAPQKPLPIGRVFGPTVVGFLAINTLPARIGEFVRAYLLARLERLPAAGVLGSCALERVLDLALLAVFWVIALLFAPFPNWFRVSGYLTFGLGGIAALALWLFQKRGHHHAGRLLDSGVFSIIPVRFRDVIRGAIPAFGEGLAALGSPGVLPRATAWSVLMWLANSVGFLVIGYAMGLDLPWWSPFLLTFVVCVAISLPSSPGFVGVMEGACVVGLGLLGVDGARGLAYGILYHLTQIVPLILLGSYFAIRAHLRPADLAASPP